jgi:rSAM/selenodomain-associated transferase 2
VVASPDRLAVVIPALDEESMLPVTLARLAEVAPEAEVVVADGGSRDGTLRLAAAFPRVRFLRAPRGRGPQMNAGAAESRGDPLLFLHADTLPPANLCALVDEALARPRTAAGSFCLRLEPSNPLLAFYSLCSRIPHPLFTYGDQGLFLCRSTFEAVGGFAPLPLFEDVEIQDRLRRHGRFVKLPVPVVSSARRFRARGILRQQLANLLLVVAYRAGGDPRRLARRYERSGSRRC